MPKVEHRTRKSRTWRAWTGTRSDLRRVGLIANELFAARRKALADEFLGVDEAATIDMAAEAAGVTRERIRQMLRQELARFNGMKLDATVTHGADSTTGSPDDVLQELDRRTVTKYSIEGSFHYTASNEALGVTFVWPNGHQEGGVTIEVGSSDLGWANQAFAMLSEEIDKGRPRWHWMHTAGGRLTLYALTTLAAWTSLTAATISLTNDLWRVATLSLANLTASCFITFVLWASGLHSRIFPAIELQGEDYQSTTGRRIAFFVSLIASVFIGIFVNIIS